ncbi:MAG TPA: Ig domain-containing protein [Acidobacteriota bacterium]|nr:Ig domain-containing protein [Acidobacteriota bacterium]HQO20859.1 Ig domain-containing protein [Acidobacteriota bacterium]HQQ47693.1 Ig domain-containing protein [Acidobacteriota bacterium]
MTIEIKRIFAAWQFIILTALLLVDTTAALSQTTWAKTYGGEEVDWVGDMQQTKDGGFIIAGGKGSSSNLNSKISILKLNSLGNIIWQKAFGDDFGDGSSSILETSDGGYILLGSRSDCQPDENADVLILKIDNQGRILWQKTYEGPHVDVLHSIKAVGDTGYILCGFSNSFFNQNYDIWLVRTDLDANILWQKRIGIINDEFSSGFCSTSDGGYLITGTNTYENEWDLCLVKIDSEGKWLFTKYLNFSSYQTGSMIKNTKDGGFIVAGRMDLPGQEGNMAVVKLDADANLEWQRNYGDSSFDWASYIEPTPDGGYVVGGTTQTTDGNDLDCVVLKLDNLGNILWQRRFGGASTDQLNTICMTSDGGLVLAGKTYSYGAGLSDIMIIKMDSHGIVDSSCPLSRDATFTTREAFLKGYRASHDEWETTATISDGSTSPLSYNLEEILQCEGNGCPKIDLNPSSFGNGTIGASYNVQIVAGGGKGPYEYSLDSGVLPPGLTLTVGGLLSGTPSFLGSFTFGVTATDQNSCKGRRDYSLRIDSTGCPPISILPDSISEGIRGIFFQQALSAQGGAAPYKYILKEGSLPTGLSLTENGIISGTPSSEGTFDFVVSAVDAAGCTGEHPFTILVNAVEPPVITSFQKLGSPFRLRMIGTNFHSDATIYIGANNDPWTNFKYKSQEQIVLKGGASLKAKFPKGIPVDIKIINGDGGTATLSYMR